ncbi:MAG: AraC family transcriptional regulator, positive regulator of tynA and feaB [Pseudonocardiales bacterium]|jgi:AraC-like DNA-binding protein|nr:AraC family transcriptional regulator, positive regulator of tynA and feaB [Pseudonocardiales bacterium]
MVLLLDTDTVPEQDRVEALHAAFDSNEAPQIVTFGTTFPVRHRMDLFAMGPGTHLLRNVGTGLDITRGPAQVRQAAPEQAAVGFQASGHSVLAAAGSQSVAAPGELVLVDVTSPYAYRQSSLSSHKVLVVDNQQLALPVEVVRIAAPRLRVSPVYNLVRAHFARLFENPTELPAPAQAMVGRATVQLVKALITTAADNVLKGDAMNSTLHLRVTMFIDAHLHDQTLNADRIAAAHHISSRQLYKVWADAGHALSLSQWIIHRRLDRARNQLTDLDPQVATVAAIGHACGFSDMSHFSRRFREVYGLSPRDWRRYSRMLS